MEMKHFRRRVFVPISEWLDMASSLAIFILLFLLAWKLVWGVLGQASNELVVDEILLYLSPWPGWLRMLIGLPLLLIVFSPLIIAVYVLFDEPRLLWKLVEWLRSEQLSEWLDPFKKTMALFGIVAVLVSLWDRYDDTPNDFFSWWNLAQDVFPVLL